MRRKNGSTSGQADKLGRVGHRPYWLLLCSVLIRALHQVGAAVYLASYLVPGYAGPPAIYLLLSVVTGIALYGTEAMRHRQLHREVAGVSTIFKLLLLGAAYHRYGPETALVLVAFVMASLAAHLPREVRHHLLY